LNHPRTYKKTSDKIYTTNSSL